MERIQKVIASSGYCSRRKAEELIEAGKVKVNGEIVKTMGYKASVNDFIEVDNDDLPIEWQEPEQIKMDTGEK